MGGPGRADRAGCQIGTTNYRQDEHQQDPSLKSTEGSTVPVPKRKMSRSNTRHRRAQWKTTVPNLVTCTRCKEKRLAHTACPTCGTYAKRRVLDV
jgi:large subunit ribosomal protein L32